MKLMRVVRTNTQPSRTNEQTSITGSLPNFPCYPSRVPLTLIMYIIRKPKQSMISCCVPVVRHCLPVLRFRSTTVRAVVVVSEDKREHVERTASWEF